MRTSPLALAAALILWAGCSKPPEPPKQAPSAPKRLRVKIEDGKFIVDGERFLVRGVGYELGSRPGQYPWSRKFDLNAMRRDLRFIREAGFNTVRCWDGYTGEELGLIENNGLWVIQGLGVDSHGNFASADYQKKALARLEEVVKRSRRHENILAYLVMNETDTDTILRAGEAASLEFFQKLVARVHELDPGVPVSFSNTCTGEFLDPGVWDWQAFNCYMYSPATIRHVLGYRGYIEWLKKRAPAAMPLVISEFGLSVSRKGEGHYGYGGNTLEEQEAGVVRMLDDLLQAGADGGCVFSFQDGWWKNANTKDDARTHDDEPEEWYGILGIDDEKSDPGGTPRPVYYALQKANRAYWITPVSWREYRKEVPFEVYTTEDVTSVTALTASGRRLELERKGSWWRGTLPASELQGVERLTLVVESLKLGELRQARSIVTNWAAVPAGDRPVQFSVEKAPRAAGPRDWIEMVLRVSSESGGVTANRKFTVGHYPHEGWDPGYAYDATSDSDGKITLKLAPLNHSGVVTVSISTGLPSDAAPTWGNAFMIRVRDTAR